MLYQTELCSAHQAVGFEPTTHETGNAEVSLSLSIEFSFVVVGVHDVIYIINDAVIEFGV